MTSAVELTQNYVAQTYKRPPFVLTHGEGMKVWDDTGKEYLDMVAGIAVMALGHSDPQVAEVIREHADKLIHVSNLYHTAPQAELAQLLCEKSFADRVFFCNSGAEAIEACIKFARKYAFASNDHQRREIISFSNAFHGRTMGALAVTPKEPYQKPFQPLMGAAKTLPFNDIAAAEAGITEETCAVLIEPIQGEGGVYPASAEFIQKLRQLCDERGALLVFDEVQCGLGRTGTLWAYEQYGVTPDLMALAKPLAAGLPMGACLMTEKVHTAVAAGDHGSTFAGGALVTSVAHHVLERVSQPEFLAHVTEVGAYLWERLHELNAPQIVDIRGRGLMVGMELNIPAADLITVGYEHGLLMVGAGTHTLRFVPPLIMEKSDVDTLVERLEHIFIQRSNHV